jgi:hypothetical protein
LKVICIELVFQVFNIVVDMKKPESVLVCDRATAEHLFSHKDRVPVNATKIITPDFYEYFPPTTGNLLRRGCCTWSSSQVQTVLRSTCRDLDKSRSDKLKYFRGPINQKIKKTGTLGLSA